MVRKYPLFLIAALFGLVGCNLLTLGQDVTPTAEPTPTSTPTLAPVVSPSPTAETMELPAEAIMVLEPGPGSRVVSPLRVEGEADPTFEQSLAVVLMLEDGTQLAIVPAQIQADLGERGPFSVEMPFTVTQEQQAFLQVFADSPRDGGVTHLTTVGLTLLPTGQTQIIRREPYPEQIHITSPAVGEVIRGGLVRVEGIAVASFEQTLIVEVLDEDGDVLVSQPITLAAEELGVHAPFETNLAYVVTTAQAGRVVVRDPSPAFPGDQHVASVEIRLEP